MNHFQAVEEMRRLAARRNLSEVEIEICQGVACQGGQNVEGQFQSGDNQVSMFWDAAFQGMTISGPFGSETIRY